jgi:hypothetical protein
LQILVSPKDIFMSNKNYFIANYNKSRPTWHLLRICFMKYHPNLIIEMIVAFL